MNSRKVKIILILSITFNFSFLATAVYSRWYPPEENRPVASAGRLHNKHLLLEKLGVSGTQQHEIMEEIQRFHAEIDQLNRTSDTHKAALVDEILADRPDAAGIQANIAAISTLQKKLQESTVSHFLRLKKSFTPEQMENLMQQVKKAMKIDENSTLF